jgi:SPX domain protein involved in polyphosphate accumulation
MKFGQALRRKVRPEWAMHYLNYKQLKKQIKAAVANAEAATTGSASAEGGAPHWDLGFQALLSSELQRVNDFYGELTARLQKQLDAASDEADLKAVSAEVDELRRFVVLNSTAGQ